MSKPWLKSVNEKYKYINQHQPLRSHRHAERFPIRFAEFMLPEPQIPLLNAQGGWHAGSAIKNSLIRFYLFGMELSNFLDLVLLLSVFYKKKNLSQFPSPY